MKIVIISPFQNHLGRGIERFTYSIANIMAKQGHEVIIYAWKSKTKFSWGKTHNNVTLKLCPNFRYYTDVLSDEYKNLSENVLYESKAYNKQIFITPHCGGMTTDARAIAYHHAADLLIEACT